jgi:hypothetical protein
MFIDAFTISSQGNLRIYQLQILGAILYDVDLEITFNACRYIIQTQRYILTGWIGLAVQRLLCHEQVPFAL